MNCLVSSAGVRKDAVGCSTCPDGTMAADASLSRSSGAQASWRAAEVSQVTAMLHFASTFTQAE